mmetsp:Transcript_39967/g.125548  ORF Transcript_39967/g.125548 Transcript_39967/m.125548 type:complete len:227 (-) Transcript_39967:1252-1932(-)
MGSLALLQLRACCGLLHGHLPCSLDAIGGRRVRQRGDCCGCDLWDLLLLGAIAEGQLVVVVWSCDGPHVHLHGGGMGRLHLRAQHDRSPCCRADHERSLLAEPVEVLLHLLRHGHPRSHPVPRRRVRSPQVAGAAGPSLRVLLAAAHGGLQALRAGASGHGRASHPRLLHARLRRSDGGRACGDHDLHAPWLPRAHLCSRAGTLCAAHEDGKSAGRLGRRAPGDQG